MTADKTLSCAGLGAFLVGSAVAASLIIYQLVFWLVTGMWHPFPLDLVASCIRSFGSNWVGLQMVYSLILALPLSLVSFLVGVGFFWVLGVLSSKAYKKKSESEGKQATPAQTQA